MKKAICPHCFKFIEHGLAVCSNCKKEIVNDSSVNDLITCPYCNEIIKSGAALCKHCKKDLQNENSCLNGQTEQQIEETPLKEINGIRCYNSEKPGQLIIGSYLGKLVLTNHRLIFLSSGGNNMLTRVGSMLVAGPVGMSLAAKASTKNIVLSGLDNKGSLSIPLDQIEDYNSKRRLDGAAYLSIRLKDNNGLQKYCSFMTEAAISSLNDLETDIKKAKDNFVSTVTTKKCLFCAEIIKKEARVCRYCSRDLPASSFCN